jgi:hypothetical protein
MTTIMTDTTKITAAVPPRAVSEQTEPAPPAGPAEPHGCAADVDADRTHQARLDTPAGELAARAAEDQRARTQLPPPNQTPLYRAMNGDRYERQTLIKQIQDVTGRPLICMVFGPGTGIERTTFAAIGDLVHRLDTGTDLDVLLHTLGGDLDTAAKIALLLRNVAADTGRIRVIVPDHVKSAGTLIALAADQIVMSDTSELGPIDPLISITLPDGSRVSRPAQAYLDSFNDAIERAQLVARRATADAEHAYAGAPTSSAHEASAEAPAEAWIWQTWLRQIEPSVVQLSRKALERSRRYAEQILREGMFRGDPSYTSVARELSNNNRWLTHGAVIDANAAASEVGLKIDKRARQDPLWRAWWQLYCIQRLAATGDSALLESDYVSLCS